jgi:hypothetical protein
LEGRVVSPNSGLSFEPVVWEGNRQKISCRFSPNPLEGWKPGDVRSFSVQLLSNGGEAVLPVTARLAEKAIVTDEGSAIANLQDFYAYALNFPKEAQKLFADEEFFILLQTMDFPYIDAYSLLAGEANRPRALDNFLILAGMKKRSGLSPIQPQTEHRSFENSMIYGHFGLQKSDGGYIEADIITGSPWLRLAKDKLITEDFKNENTAVVKYSIDPLLIPGRYARETVRIRNTDGSEEAAMDIIFKRPQPLRARLLREGYRFRDEGTIIVENQTGRPMMAKLSCNEAFVRFFQREYKVEGQLQIPFIIKLPPLQSAQMLFRKIPSLFADIEIKAFYKDTLIKKTMRLTAGEW